MLGLERGFDRAFRRIGWQRGVVKSFVEIEAFIIENLVCQMESGVLDPAPVWSNLKTFRPEPFRGKIDFITGGYPCQPFSVAGLGKGTEDPRHLFPYIDHAIDVIRPVGCFFENVSNHLNIGYEAVRARLQELGYHVEEGIYSAEEVGAPHKRERMFILAIKLGVLLEHPKGGRAGELSYEAGSGQGHGVTGTGGIFAGTTPVGVNLVDSDSIGQHDVEENTWQFDPNKIGQFPITEQERHSKQCGISEPGEFAVGLADSSSPRLQGHAGDEHGTRWAGVGPDRPAAACRVLSTEPVVGDELADSDNSGSRENLESGQLRPDGAVESPENSWRADTGQSSEGPQGDRWPARPGEEQYDWECPRVESKVGVTINGYNFREDLLRMAGNGVVEDTAEVAFLDLLQKHYLVQKSYKTQNTLQ